MGGKFIRRILYRTLSFEQYLKTLSRMFFIYYRYGIGRNSEAMEYPHHLCNLVASGDTVIDIGANLGYYSRILSELVGDNGKVYAIEPVKPILNVLKYNLRNSNNVRLYNCALGDSNELITMRNDFW